MSLETVPDCDYQLEIWRAVKQYSRSSADQEIPMCYELRPPVVLERTCAYLLCEIADTTRQVRKHESCKKGTFIDNVLVVVLIE